MTNLLRKSALAVLVSIFAFSTLFVSAAQAASDRPSIKSIGDKTKNSVVLKIKDGDNEKDRMRMKVKITNKKTGEVTFQTFSVRLNKDGQKKLTITGLDQNTKYSFKVKDKRRAGGDYTDYSKAKTAMTAN